MRRVLWTWGCAALVAACGGEAPGEPAAAPAREEAEASSPAPGARPDAPAPGPAPGAETAPGPRADTVPTRMDSAAAARENVSPEWKMRERQRPGYADCIEKTRNASAEARPALVAACNRLPDAPG